MKLEIKFSLNFVFQTGAASRCWRRYPSGNGNGTENCLTLDIFTPNVVYDALLPVVVYVDGDDLSEEEDDAVRPSAGKLHFHKMKCLGICVCSIAVGI